MLTPNFGVLENRKNVVLKKFWATVQKDENERFSEGVILR
jgi:hypothetical protein